MAGSAETAVANLTILTSIGGNAMNALSKNGDGNKQPGKGKMSLSIGKIPILRDWADSVRIAIRVRRFVPHRIVCSHYFFIDPVL